MDRDHNPPCVAVVNTSEDIITFLEHMLSTEGYRTTSGYAIDFRMGREDVDDFFRQCDPPVVIWDVSLPYEENWRFFNMVRHRESAAGRKFIVTSTNKQAVRDLIGPVPVHELIGKPYDVEEILSAVRRAL